MPRKVIKLISFLLCVCLLFQQTGFAQVAGQLDISGHILSLRNSFIQDKFRPLHLRYLSYDPLNNNFRLLLDKGDFEKAQGLSPSELKGTLSKGTVPNLENATKELLNYFFVGISLPNDSFWVNLRPDSENEVIDPELGKTDLGKILLEADLQLKQDTAKFTSPETFEGKKYWDKLYKKAEELFGYENITIPTLTRPWIVPDEIIIRETQDNAYIYKATLKVMLEQDYLKDSSTYNFKDPRLKALNEYSSQLIRELIIPKLTKEINTSKRYAPLRQVYYSLILAQWFKQRFYGKGGLYSWLIDKKNLSGLTSKTPWSKTTYFQAYQKSFKEGEYNLKEPIYIPYGQTIRSYMSGGIGLEGISGAITRGFFNAKRIMLESDLAKRLKYIIVLSVLGGSLNNPFINLEVKAGQETNPPVVEQVTTIQQEEEVKTELKIPEEIELSEIANIKLEPQIDYKIYRIKNKAIYYVEFASKKVQARNFDRLGAFVESETYSGRILEDEELKNAIETSTLTQGIGHDYKIEDICRFYTQAENTNVVLNIWEENLKEDLMHLGVIEYQNGIYKPTKKIAIISAAQDIDDKVLGLRTDTILHEYRHAIYLTEPFVRELIKKAWDSIDSNQQSKIINAVHILAGYDRKNLDLILNELYASLLDYSSPLSGIVSNNPKGWAPSPKVMSYLFAEFKRIEERRLHKGITPENIIDERFLKFLEKRIQEFGNKYKEKLSTPETINPPAQENAPKATVQQEAQVEQERNLQLAGDKNRYPYKRDPLDMFIGADSAVSAFKEKLKLDKNTTIDFYNRLSQKLIQELKNRGIDHTKELSRADKYLITVLMFKVIEEANFEIKNSSFSITLTPQFKTPVDCDLLSFIFLKMAYDLDLPLHFILMPGHAALVWRDKETTFDIDPRWELQDEVYGTFFKPLLERFEEFKKTISPQKRPDLSPEKRKELIEEALEKGFIIGAVKKYLSIDEEEHNKDRYRIELNQRELENIILFTEVQNLTAIAEDPQRFGITDFKTPYLFRLNAKDVYKRLVERSKQPECQALYAGFYINSLQELYWIDKDAGFFKNQEEEDKAWKEIDEERAKYMKFLSLDLHAGRYGDSPDQLLETQISELVSRLGVATLKRELMQARQDHEAGGISGEELFRKERRIIGKLVRGTLREFSYEEGFFDLATVLKERKADCGGFTRLIYLLGKEIGLTITPIEVTDLSGRQRSLGQSHMASFIDLSNGMKVMVEPTAGPDFAESGAFTLEKEFKKAGNWYEQKPDGDFSLHHRFRILSEAGLLAYAYNSKGFTFYKSGQYQKAKIYFEKAIGLDGELAIAYLNLGSTYTKLDPKLGKSTFYSKIALELDPKLIEGYYNLGVAYLNQGRYPEALQSFEKFLKDAPDYEEYAKYKKAVRDIIPKLTKKASVSVVEIKLNVSLPHVFQKFFNNQSSIGVEGRTVGELLQALNQKLQNLPEEVRKRVIISVNDEYINNLDPNQTLKSSDKIEIMLAISGGSGEASVGGESKNINRQIENLETEILQVFNLGDLDRTQIKNYAVKLKDLLVRLYEGNSSPDAQAAKIWKNLDLNENQNLVKFLIRASVIHVIVDQISLLLLMAYLDGATKQEDDQVIDYLEALLSSPEKRVKAEDISVKPIHSDTKQGDEQKVDDAITKRSEEKKIEKMLADSFSSPIGFTRLNWIKLLKAKVSKKRIKLLEALWQDSQKEEHLRDYPTIRWDDLLREQVTEALEGIKGKALTEDINSQIIEMLNQCQKLAKTGKQVNVKWLDSLTGKIESRTGKIKKIRDLEIGEPMIDLSVDPFDVITYIHIKEIQEVSSIGNITQNEPPKPRFGHSGNALDTEILKAKEEIQKARFNLALGHIKEAIRLLKEDADKLDESDLPVADRVNQQEIAVWVLEQLQLNGVITDKEAQDLLQQLNIDKNNPPPTVPSPVTRERKTTSQFSVFVNQREAEALAKQGIIATNVTHCIAVTLYDSTNKVGALAHFDAGTEIPTSFSLLRARIEELGGQIHRLRVRIIGGISPQPGQISEKVIAEIKEQLKVWRIEGNIDEEDTLGLKSRSVALDVSTGALYDFTGPAPLDTIFSERLKWLSKPGPITILTTAQVTSREKVQDYKNPQDGSVKGGIDFRGLPIVTQSMPPTLGTVPLGRVPFSSGGDSPYNKAGIIPVNLTKEWVEIQNMLNGGIIPSGQRIKEYLIASCQNGDFNQEIDKVLSAIVDILRIEEEHCVSTEQVLREILALLESDKSARELQVALSKIEVLPKEPALIK